MDGERNLRTISKQHQNIKGRRRIEKEVENSKGTKKAVNSPKEM